LSEIFISYVVITNSRRLSQQGGWRVARIRHQRSRAFFNGTTRWSQAPPGPQWL